MSDRFAAFATSTGAFVTTTDLAVADADGLSPELTLRKLFAAGSGGTPDDVVIYSNNAPFLFRIVDEETLISTAVGSSTVQLRDGTGGSGNACSDAFDSSSTGRKRDTGAGTTVSRTIPQGGSLVIRRSANTVAGEMIITIRKE